MYILGGVKRGDGDEEDIYLLAKDLAYYVALNRTEDLTRGIKELTKKEMRNVSDAIFTLDQTVDKRICKVGSNDWNDAVSTGDNASTHMSAGKCATKNSIGNSGGTDVGLKAVMSEANVATSNNKFTDEAKLGDSIPHTSANISTDIRGLTREQHGVVSSAFAKAHEGAEIVEFPITVVIFSS